MSKYCWESGTITIPAKEWATFRKGLLAAWNAKQEGILAEAKALVPKLRAAAKGKRGDKRFQEQKAALYRHCGFTLRSWGWECPSDEVRERFDTMRRLLFVFDPKLGPGAYDRTKLVTPKKLALDLKPVSKDADIHLPDASVHFRNKGRTVEWDVPENNHAVENARDHWFAKKLFAALRRIEWTRGSGGQIVGNDEYNRDECKHYEGGGGSYVTMEFSAAATKARRRLDRSLRRQGYRSFGTAGGWY